MRYYDWNDEKNEELRKTRNISFEIIVAQIEAGFLLDVIDNPNSERYSGQRMFIVEFNDYAYLVPFVENKDLVFLKTIFPSRKATRKYLRKG